jgi:alpha-beta hydrolase superfamily lysophospholipase
MTAKELESRLKEHNPVDRLEPLAKAKVPILHIHSDADKVVPLDANSQVLAERYKALGGPMELIVVKGKGHAEVAEFFQSERVLEFLKSGR